MREIWEELMDEIVFSVAKAYFGESGATSPPYQELVRRALLSDCVDQKIRSALQRSREDGAAEEARESR